MGSLSSSGRRTAPPATRPQRLDHREGGGGTLRTPFYYACTRVRARKSVEVRLVRPPATGPRALTPLEGVGYLVLLYRACAREIAPDSPGGRAPRSEFPATSAGCVRDASTRSADRNLVRRPSAWRPPEMSPAAIVEASFRLLLRQRAAYPSSDVGTRSSSRRGKQTSSSRPRRRRPRGAPLRPCLRRSSRALPSRTEQARALVEPGSRPRRTGARVLRHAELTRATQLLREPD
jgi:hypothetical protein